MQDTQTQLDNLGAAGADVPELVKYAGRAWAVIAYDGFGRKLGEYTASRMLAGTPIAATVFDGDADVYRVSVREGSELYVYQLEGSGMIRELELEEVLADFDELERGDELDVVGFTVVGHEHRLDATARCTVCRRHHDDLPAEETKPGGNAEYWPFYDHPASTVGYVVAFDGSTIKSPVVHKSENAALAAAGRLLDYNPSADRVRVFRIETHMTVGR